MIVQHHPLHQVNSLNMLICLCLLIKLTSILCIFIACCVGNRTDDTNHKKPQGSARPIPKWGTGERLEIEFNSFMQPVGPNADKLMSQLGVIVRNGDRVPLTYVRWTDMPIHVLDDIWREVKVYIKSFITYNYNIMCLMIICMTN